MLTQILELLLILFVSFMASHYTLSLMWKNPVGVIIASVIFALLVAIFGRGF